MGKPRQYKGQYALTSQDLLAYYRQLGQQMLTVVDLETTGSNPDRGARVVEVSILQGRLGEGILHQETHLINPGRPVPIMTTRLTGITNEVVARAPFPEVVWPECLERLEQGVLTAHNLEFDYRFLQAEYRQMDYFFRRSPQEQFCTVLLSRILLAHLSSRRLPDLVQHFQFNVGPAHRAEADTQACWLLAEWLLTHIASLSDEVLLNRFAAQWIPLPAAASLLQLPPAQARTYLAQRNISHLPARRPTNIRYRRGDIEALLPTCPLEPEP